MKTVVAIFWAGLGLAGLPCLAQNGTAAPTPTPPPAAPRADGTATVPIAVFPELRAGGKIFYDVRVRQVTPLTIVVLHRGGLASIPLADLPAEVQQQFGYNTDKAAAELARQRSTAEANQAKAATATLMAGGSARLTDQILQQFGQAPKIFAEVNMRPRFEGLGIDAKSQGARPSCAVFALVSALEFQRSPPKGPAPRLSEEYLIWATLKTLGKAGIRLPKTETPGFDVGFSLMEVAQALRTYGIALEDDLPYHLTADKPAIAEPSQEIVAQAKLRSPADGFWITGREAKTRVANLVHALNFGMPVVAGIKWPDDKTLRTSALLDAQPGLDNNNHALLIVGYRSKTGKLEDTEFVFKNSYGPTWGDHGYGTISYRYLEKNLETAMFMDVH